MTGAVDVGSGGALARVGVVYGGPSPEHDVSILTGLQAVRGLSDVRDIAEVHSLYWSKTGEWFEVPVGLEASAFVHGPPPKALPLRLTVGAVGAVAASGAAGASGGFASRRSGRFNSKDESIRFDALMNCCHGGPGEDGSLQGVLDLTGIPYSGPTLAGALIGMDKLAFGALAASAGLKMLPRVPLSEHLSPPGFEGPYIVKPRFGGSSIGIEVVADYETARARLKINPHLTRGAVLEPYQPELFDLQVAVRMWPDPQLSAIEKPLRARTGGEILAYADKYVGAEGMTNAPRELPAPIASELEYQIRVAAAELASLVGVRGVARIDFLSDGDSLYVNEINTIPGSLARHLWIDPVVPFATLLHDLLREAVARPSVRFSVAGSDGSVLRGAGSISSKLS